MMSIASGSSGNCIYIGSDRTHILIDAGISRKKVVEGLKKLDLCMDDMDAILVTHEHSDHTKGIGVISRKDEIPLYATRGTMEGIMSTPKLGEISGDLFHQVRIDEDFCINDLMVHPFGISHDANEPCAYTVSCGNHRMGVVTDLGKYDDYIIENLQGMEAFLVEANHDIRMLQVGSYPYYLKQRILGDRGHLSNEASGRLLGRILNDNVKGVLLGHLSAENNFADLAYETVKLEIDMGDTPYRSGDFCIQVAGRNESSAIFEV